MNRNHLFIAIGGLVVGYLIGKSYITAATTAGSSSTLTSIPGLLSAIQAGEKAAGATIS